MSKINQQHPDPGTQEDPKKEIHLYTLARQDCVAAQAYRHLYRYSSKDETLTILAEITDFVRSMETPLYPRA